MDPDAGPSTTITGVVPCTITRPTEKCVTYDLMDTRWDYPDSDSDCDEREYYDLLMGPSPPSSPLDFDAYANPFLSAEEIFESASPLVALSPDFLDVVKICVAKLLGLVIRRHVKSQCYGCEVDHPNTLSPSKYYVSTHFNDLMKSLWSGRFISGVMRVLETQGIVMLPSRVHNACESFIHDLKKVENIEDEITEIMNNPVLGGSELTNDLLDELVTYWDVTD